MEDKKQDLVEKVDSPNKTQEPKVSWSTKSTTRSSSLNKDSGILTIHRAQVVDVTNVSVGQLKKSLKNALLILTELVKRLKVDVVYVSQLLLSLVIWKVVMALLTPKLLKYLMRLKKHYIMQKLTYIT